MTAPESLLEAYKAATGLPVYLSQARMMNLTEMVQRGIEPQDITAVVEELKKLIKRDTRGIYTWTCLDFRCCMDPDKMEERALNIRARKIRMGRKTDQVPTSINDGKGVIHLLADPVPEEPRRADAAAALHNIADSITKKAS